MARNTRPQRRIETTAWRPGLWVTEAGDAVSTSGGNAQVIHAVMITMVRIGFAMARADQTIRQRNNDQQRKDQP